MKRRMRMIAKVMVFVLLFMTNTVSGAAETAKFPDVPDTAWYMDDLQYILKDTRKIFSGYPDGSFEPNDTLTVDMFIKLIVTVMGHQVENGKEYWASTYIEKAMEEGYIVEHSYNNMNELSFDTNDKNDPYQGYKKPIDRRDMAFLIGKALDKITDDSEYRDLLAVVGLIKDYRSIPIFYRMNIVKCYDLGIITGYPDGEFKPDNILTRAEAVAVIRRLIDPSARIRMPLPGVANPSPTPIPVAQLNRPAKKDLGNGVVEVEGVSFDPAENIINKQNGAMHILKAQDFLGVFLEYLTFYEYDGKARVKGYIPELPENYQWGLSIKTSVKEPDDRGYYGPSYLTDEGFSPEQTLPEQGHTFDKPLYTNKENITYLVVVCEILTPSEATSSRFWISLTEGEYSMTDWYGGFSGTHVFDGRGFFEW
jgi:hypothetical protein